MPISSILSMLRYWWWLISQNFPPASSFNVEQISDLTGQVIIVTGGNAGIGRETVKVLLQHNATVYMASRNRHKAEKAIKEIKGSIGKEAIFLELDLSDFGSIRRAAKEFLSKETELHVLFNNAGVMFSPVEQLTTEGYDMQFGTNVIGHFLFTHLLIPALLAGKETSQDGYSRIITTTSSMSYLSTIDYDTIRDGPKRRQRGVNLYCQSKFANIVIALEHARRYGDKGILSFSCHPGSINTDLHSSVASWQRKLLIAILFHSVSMGALTQLYAGTMTEPIQNNGQYYIPWARKGRCRDEAYDPRVGKELWDYLMEQIKDRR
ncbi:NAD(P)-binding domain superfamily protein [Abortiporus biennis]